MVNPRLLFICAALCASIAHADNLDTLGFTSLRALHPELTGAGQTVATAEAGPPYQIDPSVAPSATIHYYDSDHAYGTAGASFTSASGHATGVAANLLSGAYGVSTVENFSADYFANSIVIEPTPTAIASPIVNQSFVFTDLTASEITAVSAYYDYYASTYGTLFVNGLNNGTGTLTNAPASMYNGIAVGLANGNHSGRALLVAPEGATSFATPWVTAAAAVLRQAGTLGYFNAQTASNATDARVLKAGLLNGATKTAAWTHTSTDPLDATYGSGVVNVQGAFDTLSGGEKSSSSSALVSLGSIPNTAAFTAPLSGLSGWDLNTVTASVNRDRVVHYFFDITSTATLTFTATLTWNSIANPTLGTDAISNFDLVLVDANTHEILWSSVSTAFNVEQIYLTDLSAAKYDLQVILRGGFSAPTFSDTYAVAWRWDSTTVSPVPESDAFWLIGVMGVLFIIRKRLAASRG